MTLNVSWDFLNGMVDGITLGFAWFGPIFISRMLLKWTKAMVPAKPS